MKAVVMRDEHYFIIVPEARCTLVLTKAEFIGGLQRAKQWKRRQTQAAREAEAAPLAEDKRFRWPQDAR
jgi:hypothetical protein